MTLSEQEKQRLLSEHFRKLGEKGGAARFADLSDKEKSELGAKGAAGRWKGHKKKNASKKKK